MARREPGAPGSFLPTLPWTVFPDSWTTVIVRSPVVVSWYFIYPELIGKVCKRGKGRVLGRDDPSFLGTGARHQGYPEDRAHLACCPMRSEAEVAPLRYTH